jgi:hypothetical protein
MLVALGLVLAVVLVAIYSRPAMRGCRWREDRAAHRAAGRTAWRCAACGATAETDGIAPRRCLGPGAA